MGNRDRIRPRGTITRRSSEMQEERQPFSLASLASLVCDASFLLPATSSCARIFHVDRCSGSSTVLLSYCLLLRESATVICILSRPTTPSHTVLVFLRRFVSSYFTSFPFSCASSTLYYRLSCYSLPFPLVWALGQTLTH